MKEIKYIKEDGTKGLYYKPENNDEIVSVVGSAFISAPRDITVNKGTDKEQKKTIRDYGLSCTYNGKHIFVKLTDGQYKYLQKVGDLMEKKIKFEEYQSKNYGTLLGIKVLQ